MDKIDVIDKIFEKWCVCYGRMSEIGKEIEAFMKQGYSPQQQFRSDFIEAVKAVLPERKSYKTGFVYGKELSENCRRTGFNSCLDTIHKNLEGMK